MDGVALSIDFEDFRGTGLTSGVSTANSLDSDDWAIDFDDDGTLDADFGADNTAGNFAGGVIVEPGRYSIELTGLYKGTYLLRAQLGGQWFFKRIIKQ